MNYNRRSRLATISFKIMQLRDELDAIAEEEQESFDNLPEGIQDSEKGQKMEENVSQILDVAANLEGIAEALDDVTN